MQGVFYRATCRDRAASLKLSGWVRNRADGVVEAVAEGGKSEVESFIDWCRQGPREARVDEVDVTWENPGGEKGGFRITG